LFESINTVSKKIPKDMRALTAIIGDFKKGRAWAEVRIEIAQVLKDVIKYQEMQAQKLEHALKKQQELVEKKQLNEQEQKQQLEQESLQLSAKIAEQKALEEQQRIVEARKEAEELKTQEEWGQRVAAANALAREQKLFNKSQRSSPRLGSSPTATQTTDSDEEQYFTFEKPLIESPANIVDVNKLLDRLSKANLKILQEMLSANSSERHLEFKYTDIKKIVEKLGVKKYKSHSGGSARTFKLKDKYIMISLSYHIHEPHNSESGFVEGVCIKNLCTALETLNINKTTLALYLNENHSPSLSTLSLNA
jgi:hypothetical protein